MNLVSIWRFRKKVVNKAFYVTIFKTVVTSVIRYVRKKTIIRMLHIIDKAK